MVNRRGRGGKNGSSITRVKRLAMREIQGGSVNNRFIRCALSRRRKNFFRPLKREFASLFLLSRNDGASIIAAHRGRAAFAFFHAGYEKPVST